MEIARLSSKWIIFAGFKHSHYFFVLDVLSAELAINNAPSAPSSGSIFIAGSRFCLLSETTRK